MTKLEFMTLFSHLPLNDSEIEDLKTNYWEIYKTFLGNGTDPKTSWLAVRNIFAFKNQQIAERIKNG